MGSCEVASKDVVVVTGFGSFGVHTINASTEAVKLLPTLDIENELNIQLVIVKEIPVVYDYVQNNIPELWKTYKPKLMIHVGVSGYANEVNLERQAFNTNYCSPDVNGCVPDKSTCIAGSSHQCIASSIDMAKVCEVINTSTCGVASCVSDDPGRYLCEFIYYTSLNVDRTRTAFIHVPVLDKPYTALQLAQALKVSIAAMLEQVRENDRASTVTV